jgi:hypothetical protein
VPTPYPFRGFYHGISAKHSVRVRVRVSSA